VRWRLRTWQTRQRRLRFYRQFIPHGGLCFDVGANVGNRADLFLALGARVIAVEPVAETAALLRQRFAQNSRLIVLETALDATEGQTTITVCSPHWLSSISADWLAATERTGRFPRRKIIAKRVTSLTTLDHLISVYGVPAFIKIDVEGYELQVLRGLSQPVPTLSFEYHPETLHEAAACLEHLTSLGALHANFSRGESLTWALPEWQTPAQLLAQLNEETTHDRLQFGDIYVRYERPHYQQKTGRSS